MGLYLECNDATTLINIKPKTFEDGAFGCILGAFVADSCGSRLEFAKEIVEEKDMDICMTMPGGGPWKIGAG